MIDFEKAIIESKNTILQAMNAIDAGGCKTVFVIDKESKLIGSLTDGDIRRALIRGTGLEAPIDGLVTKNPICLNDKLNLRNAKAIMIKHTLSAMPVVDKDNKVVDVIRLIDLTICETKGAPVIIMAGGLGRRLGNLVSEVPKPMLKIAGQPILLHIIEHLKKNDFTNICISVNYKSHVIEEYFGDGDDFDCQITYIKEHKPLGTGGSIKLCDAITDQPFIVVNGDILTNMNIKKMLDFHINQGFDMTIGAVEHSTQIDFGVLKTKGDIVEELVEKPTFHYQINGGVYCLNPSVIQYIPEDEYFEITELIHKDIKVGSYQVEDYWIDIGRTSQLEMAQREFRKLIESS